MIHYIDELKTEDLKGKKVLLRLDLNAPLVNGVLTDTYRIEKIISTVDFLREKEAQVIIIAHAENKDGGNESLVPVHHFLSGFFPLEFCPTYFTPEAIDKLVHLENGSVILFENVRINPGEKENDPDFTKKLSQMGDIYVNGAFSVSHRNHASIVGLPKLIPHYGGLLMRQEIEHLSKAFHPEHPFIFILGGAKFDTKMPLIKKYLTIADYIFVGGALANNIFKERGYELGTSLVSPGDFGMKEIESPKLMIPVDVTVQNKEGPVVFKTPDKLESGECIVDAGPLTIEQLRRVITGSKTVVWNGPLGNYEAGFSDKTESLAELMVEATISGTETILGGGDTIASINKLNLHDKFSFISTGGGAMLDFLVNETLPGIQALEN